jgi:DNA-binding NarL/FixJ family response regulator
MKYKICLINFDPEFDLNKLLFLLKDFDVEQYSELNAFINQNNNKEKSLLILIGNNEKQILDLPIDLKEYRNLIISHFTESVNLYNLILAGCNGFIETEKLEENLNAALKNLYSNLFFIDTDLMGKVIKFFQNSQHKEKEKLKALLNKCESEIIKLILQGKNDFDIKKDLNLSANNYTEILNNIKLKLNAKSRSEIAILALQNNL